MPTAPTIPTLNGHPPPAANGDFPPSVAPSLRHSVAPSHTPPFSSETSAFNQSASASQDPGRKTQDPSVSSAHSAASDFASFPTQDPGPKTQDPSPCLCVSVVNSGSSGLSTDNPALILDLLTGEFLLPHIAARHNVPLAGLNAWVDSDQVQSLLESCRRISAWRARYMALDSIPRAIHGLLTTMEQNPGTEQARRAATSIINLAFRKTPSPSGGGWSPDSVGRPGEGHHRRTHSNPSDERDQCPVTPGIERESPPVPKASTEVAIPARRTSDTGLQDVPARRDGIQDLVSPDPTPDQTTSACPVTLRENFPVPADRLAEIEAQRAELQRATKGLCGADQKRLVKQAHVAMRARSRAPT